MLYFWSNSFSGFPQVISSLLRQPDTCTSTILTCGAAATTGVSLAAGSYVAASAADNHTLGGWLASIAMGDGLEIGAAVSIAAVASAAQLQALSADYATGRICTPAALTEDFAFRAPLMPPASTATGAYVRGTGATARALVTSAPLRVTAR